MECKGRRTMKCCVSPVRPEVPTSTSTSSPSWLVHSWSVCWGGASQHYSRPVEFPGGRKSSSGSSPHIKMTKQRKTPQKKLLRWSQMRGQRCMRAVVDEGGNESQGCSAGPRWMVWRALSGISYRHAVNHSLYFFPVLCTVLGATAKLKLWCFFLLWLKVSMFVDVFAQFYDSLAPWDLLK